MATQIKQPGDLHGRLHGRLHGGLSSISSRHPSLPAIATADGRGGSAARRQTQLESLATSRVPARISARRRAGRTSTTPLSRGITRGCRGKSAVCCRLGWRQFLLSSRRILCSCLRRRTGTAAAYIGSPGRCRLSRTGTAVCHYNNIIRLIRRHGSDRTGTAACK
jgi:hypothetical protein